MLLLTLESSAVGEEQRAAQRIDLAEPVPAKVGDVEATMVDISLVGCRIQHFDRLAIGATIPLQFSWRGEPVRITVKVARTELRSVAGRMAYSTGLQFATSVDSSPDAVLRIMASLVKTSVAEREPEEVPIFFERAPFFREEEETPPPAPPRRPSPAAVPAKTVAPSAVEIEAGGPSFELDFGPADAAAQFDAVEPAIASRSFELETTDGLSEVEEEQESAPAPSFELEPEAKERYVQCTLENGKWTVHQTMEPKQPREGFTIVDPGDQREIDQFCRSYEYADPDTRRMIRVSCELTIAQPRSR
jgi:hypothetical protein